MAALRVGNWGDWVTRRRIELGLGLRITVAGLVAFALGHLFGEAHAYWAVLSAVIVMQSSVGGSLKATIDRLAGTLGGAVWGVAVTLCVPHGGALATGGALIAALVPLALLVAFRPAYRVAPITAAIVLLSPASADGVFSAAFDRVFEITLGSAAALAVALTVSPARAHRALYGAARRALDAMAEQTEALLSALAAPPEYATVIALHDRIRAAIENAAATADETARERRSYISDAPDPEPLVRTLRRLSHDLVIVGRVLREPMPEPVREPLSGPAAALGAALGARMRAIGDVLENGRIPPGGDAVAPAAEAYAAAISGLRRDRVTVTLPDAEVERLFGLSFGLEQLRRNLDDMAVRAGELVVAR